MIPYATLTGTRSTIAKLQEHGWRVLITPALWSTRKTFPQMPYALDNGAWSAFQQGKPFPEEVFLAMVDDLGEGADWVVLPDIVEGGLDSLRYSEQWLDRITTPTVRLLAVQDGMEVGDVRPLLGPTLGIFLGGSTEWKLRTMPAWGQLAAERQCHFHVGRVNTAKRIRLCKHSGAHSFDGTSVTQFPDSIYLLTGAVRQGYLFSRSS